MPYSSAYSATVNQLCKLSFLACSFAIQRSIRDHSLLIIFLHLLTLLFLLDDIGHIILWTVVECDMGIIAGSLPMLRMMVKSLIRDRSTDEDHRPYKRTDDTELVTIGKLAGGHNRNRDAFRNGVTVVADNESNEGHDSDSSRNNILVTRKIETTRADHDGKRLEDGQGRSGDYEF